MSNFLHYALAFAFVLGVLIVVHEFGHYAVARLCGVKVLRFSVGFGKPLLQTRLGPDQTEWAIGIFPLGGYVKMLDEREAPVDPTEAHRAFNRQIVGKRMAIVAAGPLANFVLAIVVYWGVFMHGTEELRPILGKPPVESAAARAGVMMGERIQRVDELSVETWEDVRWAILQRASEASSVSLQLINERSEIAVRVLDISGIRDSGWDAESFGHLGLVFFRPQLAPVIGRVIADGAAAAAGIRPGDEIKMIDDAPIASWSDVVTAVRASPGKQLRVDVRRDEARLQLTVKVERLEENGVAIGRIGVAVHDAGVSRADLTVVVRYGALPALRKAVRETWEKSTFSLVMLGKMLTGEVSWKNLSGPVTIADYAGQSAKLGMEYYLKFLALVSISLGVLNLLPIPILDGGHLLYYLVEIVKRGPVSERTMEIGQQIGLALLFTLMAFAFYNDINRLVSG